MDNKEVGDAWNHIQDCREEYRQLIINLIRKLVEERANSKCESMPTCYMKNAHIEEALYEFGIDPKDW